MALRVLGSPHLLEHVGTYSENHHELARVANACRYLHCYLDDVVRDIRCSWETLLDWEGWNHGAHMFNAYVDECVAHDRQLLQEEERMGRWTPGNPFIFPTIYYDAYSEDSD